MFNNEWAEEMAEIMAIWEEQDEDYEIFVEMMNEEMLGEIPGYDVL